MVNDALTASQPPDVQVHAGLAAAAAVWRSEATPMLKALTTSASSRNPPVGPSSIVLNRPPTATRSSLAEPGVIDPGAMVVLVPPAIDDLSSVSSSGYSPTNPRMRPLAPMV